MIRLIGILTGSALAISILIVALGVPEFAAPERAEPAPVAQTTMPEDSLPPLLPEPRPEPELQTVAEIEVQAEPPPAVDEVPEKTEQNWYAFWSPFRSEIAAAGFISQLQRTTGLDYRVVKLQPGTYEVAFAYSDDSDMQSKLAQISAATGLKMTDG